MKNLRTVALMFGAALPALAVAQQPAVLTGKVTSQAGAPIEGANVYMNDLGVQALTTPQGTFTITIPAARAKDQPTNLRVRAVGYAPTFHAVRLSPGSQTINFILRDSVVAEMVTAVERAKVPFSVAREQQLGPRGEALSNVPGNADPFARFLFPPELVMQHQGALELQESQRETLQAAIQQTQSRVLTVQWALAQEGEKLTKLLNATSLNETEVLAQVDRIIAAEREIKRAHMTLMIKIKNTLTAAQQERLRALRE